MNQGKWGLFALSCGALLGCSDPFAFTISEVNEDFPQEPAYITLSSPQLYTRERLINDRRREVAYLKQVLKDSETAQFTPAIKRELQSVVAIAVALQAGFNPLAGAQAGRQDDLAQLQQKALELEMQKRITTLEAELAKLRSDQAAAADAESGVKVDPNAALSNPTDKTNAQTIPTPISPDKLKGLETALNNLAQALTKADATTPGAQPAAILATPQEIFRDREALRDEIQSILSQEELDDRHDHNGLSLYSLRFQASAFPGATKDVYGIATVRIDPPKFIADTMAIFDGQSGELRFAGLPADKKGKVVDGWFALYKTWLAHLTRLLNEPTFVTGAAAEANQHMDIEGKFAKTQIQLLGVTSGAFGVLQPPNTGISIALPVEEANFVQHLIQQQDRMENYVKAFELAKLEIYQALYNARADSAALPSLKKFALSNGGGSCSAKFSDSNVALGSVAQASDKNFYGPQAQDVTAAQTALAASEWWVLLSSNTRAVEEIGNPKVLTHGKLLALAKRSIRNSQVLASLMLALRESNSRPAADLLASTQQKFDRFYAAAIEYVVAVMLANRELGPQACAEAVELDRLKQDLADGVSVEEFAETLLGSRAATAGYAYSVAPRELVQTVSTVQTATEALQLVGALSAVLPTQGVNADLAASLSRSATGKIDALERNPLIVGFSSSAERAPDVDQQAAPAKPDVGADAAKKVEAPAGASFGWVFGPRVIVDSDGKNLAVAQTFQEQPVQADLALPGWWPEINLTAQTFWTGSPGRDLLAKGTNVRPVPLEPVDLHQDPAVLDKITEIVAGVNWGDQPASVRIRGVFPEIINVCQPTISLQIIGRNLWRGTEVYLDGLVAAEDKIRVLPDMEAIAVTFTGRELDSVLRGAASHALTVWTYDGYAQWQIPETAVIREGCSVGATTVATIAPNQSVIIAGKRLEVKIPGGLPAQRAKYQLLVRQVGSTRFNLVAENPPLLDNDRIVIAAVDAAAFKDIEHGAAVELGLRIQPNEAGDISNAPVAIADRPQVYYNAAVAITATVQGKRSNTSFPVTISSLPRRIGKAFPQLFDRSIPITISHANGIKGVLVLEPAPSDLATSGTGTLTINAPADEAKLGELIKTDPTVTVQLNIPDELSAIEPLLPTFAGIKIPKESW